MFQHPGQELGDNFKAAMIGKAITMKFIMNHTSGS